MPTMHQTGRGKHLAVRVRLRVQRLRTRNAINRTRTHSGAMPSSESTDHRLRLGFTGIVCCSINRESDHLSSRQCDSFTYRLLRLRHFVSRSLSRGPSRGTRSPPGHFRGRGPAAAMTFQLLPICSHRSLFQMVGDLVGKRVQRFNQTSPRSIVRFGALFDDYRFCCPADCVHTTEADKDCRRTGLRQFRL